MTAYFGLSPKMVEAVKFAQQNCGGKLYRHPGGYWGTKEYIPHFKSFGTSTVEGIVRRGAANYSEWKEGKNGRFPIEVTMTHDAMVFVWK